MAMLVIPTRDRPQLLLRALSSYTSNARQHGHAIESVVVDDAADSAATEAAVAADVPQATVLSRNGRGRFATRAARDLGIDEGVVSFGLLGTSTADRTTGAARNAAILATVGRPVVSVDDDTACELWSPATRARTTAVVRGNPQRAWFITDGVPPQIVAADADFIGAHERMLGCTPRELGVESSGNPPLDSLLDVRIVVTVAGAYGKPGMDTSPHLLLDDESFGRIASGADDYARARQCGELVRLAPASSVTAAPVLMSTAVGLDNRLDLPPFCPVERNQDGMYGALLRRVFAPASFCHVPLAVRHDDGRPLGPWGDRVWTTIVPRRFCDVFIGVLSFLVADAATDVAAERLIAIGRQLAAMRRMSLSSFRELAGQLVRLGAMHRRRLLARRRAANPSAPALLHEDMQRALRLLDAAEVEPLKHLAGSEDTVLDTWRRAIADYGELMIVWPALRQFAALSPDAWRGGDVARASEPPAATPSADALSTNGPVAGPPFECPLCGWRLARFLPHGRRHEVLAKLHVVGGGYRPNAICPMCLSMDRERLVYLYLRHHTRLLQLQGRLLHIAPERQLGWWLRSLPSIHYISADRASGRGVCRLDVVDLPFPDNSLDVIVCNHVLEHVPDDEKAMKELHRVLRKSGFAVLQVPIGMALEQTYEEPSISDAAERESRFGQADHLRIYGRDYPQRLARAGFECRLYNPVADLGAEMVRRFCLIEGERLHVVRKR